MKRVEVSHFEQQVVWQLKRRSVEVTENYSLPVSGRPLVDLMIIHPLRAAVEIRAGMNGPADARTKRLFASISSALEGDWHVFVIHINSRGRAKSTRTASTKPLIEIRVPDWTTQSAHSAADQIVEYLRQICPSIAAWIDTPALKKKKIINSDLTREILPFRTYFDSDHFQQLTSAIETLELEGRSRHYRALAICLGVVTESVIYGLCAYAGIKLDKPSVEGFEKLEETLNSLHQTARRGWTESERPPSDTDRNDLRRASEILKQQIDSVTENILNVRTAKVRDAKKMNPDALVRAMQKRLSNSSALEIKTELEKKRESILRVILDLRNSAAHANLSGKWRDHQDRECVNARAQLREWLVLLRNVAAYLPPRS